MMTHTTRPSLGTAALLGLLLMIGVPRARAQPLDVGALPGLIIDEADVPVDAFGQPQLDNLPGVRARQPLPAQVARRLLELSEERTAIGAVSPAGAAPALIAPLPGDVAAPARRDSGDRDPDRLLSPPPLPRDR
jgi:hypothetical protein